jgi:hypothetical protein
MRYRIIQRWFPTKENSNHQWGPGVLNVTLDGVEIKAEYDGESSDDREFNDLSKSQLQKDGINEQHALMLLEN